MHDLHLAQKIIKLVVEHAEKNKLKRVWAARIGLGEIIEHGERIIPENLAYNLGLLAKDTVAEGAKFDIQLIKGGSYSLDEIEGE